MIRMTKKRIMIEISPATHAVLKRSCAEQGMTMDTLIGAMLDNWEKLPDEQKQKSAAVWDACRAFWKTMNETK